MKFVLWFEFERITEGTLMANEHPDWVAPNGVGVLNLGLPEAREYMTNYLNTAIKEYGVDCMRIDNAVFYEGIWKTMDEKAGKDRVGLSEIRYVEGLYKLLDDVLASNPGLFIDNCAAGGGRVDLETCSRSIPLWRTDATIDPLYQHNFNQAAMQNQVMTAGLSRYLPYSTSGQMGVEPYLFRSGFNAGISFAEDVRPANYPKDTLRQAIIEGKRLRKYYSGNFYPLTDVNINPKLWQVNQYHRSKEQDGMIVFFRRHQSPYASYVCNLREIEPGAKYKVIISRSYQQSEPVIMKGIDLQNVKVDVSECPGSVVLEYSKVSD
jgi:alpha-galactosidase